MMRDTNNVRGALQKAAGMGRGGDTQMAHVGKGEVLIPPEVIDTNPNVMAPLIKAFQKSGMDWRRYLVGSGRNSRNPRTGQREFYGGSDTTGFEGSPEHGGRGTERSYGHEQSGPARDNRDREDRPRERMEYAPSPTFEESLDIVDPEGASRAGRERGRRYGGLIGAVGGGLLGGFPGAYAGYRLGQKAGQFVGSQPPGTPGGDLANPEGYDPGSVQNVQTEIEAPAPAPPDAPMPAYLEFAPGMTPLQMRSQIASYGLNSDDTRYQTEETQDYYKSLLYTDLRNAGTLDVLTPVEQQYLKEVLGYQWGSYEELMGILNPASRRTSRRQRRFGTGMGGI